MKPERNKKYIYIGFALLVLGATGMTYPFWALQYFGDYAYLDAVASEREMGQYVIGGITATVPPQPRATDRPLPSERLVIPKAGVNMRLTTGEDVKALNKGGWIFPGTSIPGQFGNTVIFGHRFKYLPPSSNTFYNLDKVVPGDQFSIFWKGEEYRYQVIETRITGPDDLSVLDKSDGTIVTLVTCAPLFSTAQRLVVVGLLVP